MKILKKIIPYKLQRAALATGIAGATAMACAKHEPIVQHDTTYEFGYLIKMDPAQVAASADSAEVRNVFLHSNGKTWGNTFSERRLIEVYLQPSFDATAPNKRHKLRGSGTLRYVREEDPDIHEWLANFGFDFVQNDDWRDYPELFGKTR